MKVGAVTVAEPVPTNSVQHVVLRKLTEADTKALLVFSQSLSDAVTFFFRPFGDVREEVIREHLVGADADESISLGLVREDGAVVGHAFIFRILAEKPVLGIGLDESVQGCGWGRCMMEAVLAESDGRGLPLVTLTVVKDNHRAVRLYEKLGFVIRGEVTFRAANDGYSMERRSR